MHTSGKVAVGLVAVLSLAAIFLSSKALHIRSKWMEAAQKNEETIRKNRDEIQKKTRELAARQTELARKRLGWDDYWPDVPMQIGANGNPVLGIGTNFGVRPEQALFVFGKMADGAGSKYLGKFKVVRVAEGASELRPDWRVRAGDLPANTALKTRVRTLIPNPYQSRLAGLDQQLLAAEQRVAAEKSQLAKQKQLDEQTATQIALRLGEIKGNAALQGKTLPDPLIKGYLQSIADVEESGNKALVEADRLRRELKDTRRRFEETLRENQRLTDALPQGASTERTVGSTGR